MTIPPPAPPLTPEEIGVICPSCQQGFASVGMDDSWAHNFIACYSREMPKLRERLAEAERRNHPSCTTNGCQFEASLVRIVELERQLAEADAVIERDHYYFTTMDFHPKHQMTVEEYERLHAEAIARHASRHPKEPAHE